MSPLARSLLALAALLAAADAQYRQCTTKSWGTTTRNPVPLLPIHVAYPGGLIRIPNDSCENGILAGGKIKCCNSTPNGKYPPPDIEISDGIDVRLADPMGCDCSITEYCP
ncbi:uncharacterized protein LOC125227341 [Leguminivora glycinivorella]|uniref:uncharacterized protein LOC125227341 n=1 Tax=Leguminivora glycinivorella TaxID=1035111 RepID=UPI00200D95E0|nr:uncharacterized protein LOC125227341 [Leguminivora glycinivorella]